MARTKKPKLASVHFTDEAHLQELMIKAIEADDLGSLIENTLGDSNRDSVEQFPQFSLDHLSRLACLTAGRRVIKSFEYLEILTTDQNVSVTTNEIMRPDIVCINSEQQSIVMFELKVSAATGRQALTELIAYEQELKNALPFLAEYDVCHVLVSPEWSTLMDHSVASSVTWSGRQVLCLEAGLDAGNLKLKTRIPNAWKITGAAYFPELGLPCVTLCLYDLDAYTRPPSEEGTSESELDTRIWTAMTIIAREGDRVGGHGFALLWEDTSSISLTSFNITICGVSPFEFYKTSRLRGTILADDGRLVAALDSFIADHDPDGLSKALLHTAQSANNLLDEVSNPTLEGFSNWAIDRLSLSKRARPLLCEFWGALGDYARAYVLHPAVRTHRRNLLTNGTGDWRDPRVGLPLIQSFTKPDLFYEGEVRCSDAFRLGVMIGLDRLLRMNIQHGDHRQLRARYEWNRIEMMAALDEVRMLANAATNVEVPQGGFTFREDPLVDDEDEMAAFVEWLSEVFFTGNRPVACCFFVGYFGAYAFDPTRDPFDSAPSDEALSAVAQPLAHQSAMVLMYAKGLVKEGSLSEGAETAYASVRSALKLKARFSANDIMKLPTRDLFKTWSAVLSLADAIFDSVFHLHSPLATGNLDWEWLKQGVREARARGEVAFGVMLLPSGQFVTGRTTPLEMGNFEMYNDDPENKVLFMDRSNGIGSLRVVAWEDLETGKAFSSVKYPGEENQTERPN